MFWHSETDATLPAECTSRLCPTLILAWGPTRRRMALCDKTRELLSRFTIFCFFFDVGTRYSIVQYPEDYFRWVLWKHRGEFYKSKKPEKHNPASTLPRHCLPRNAAYIHSYCEWTGTNKMCFQKLRHVPFPHYLVRLYIASLLPLTSRKKKEGLLKQPGTVVPHNTVKDILH